MIALRVYSFLYCNVERVDTPPLLTAACGMEQMDGVDHSLPVPYAGMKRSAGVRHAVRMSYSMPVSGHRKSQLHKLQE